MKSGIASANGIEIAYERSGDPAQETVLLIAGLGSQLVYWPEQFCQLFVDRGFQILRMDNRDVGLSSKTPGKPPDVAAILRGKGITPPYRLVDMAADAVGLLDALCINAAHMVGVSMGGMIAQAAAIEYPQRVSSLTSIMSCAKPAVGDMDDDIVAQSLAMDLTDPETYVDLQVEGYRAISGPHFDEKTIRNMVRRSFERCYHPAGWSYQTLAVLAGGDRTAALGELSVPALIIHGKIDPLILPSMGETTAAAIPGAKMLLIEEMGHDLPRPHWAEIVDAIVNLRAL